MLSDVDFNDEDALSGAYVLKGWDRLHFKYDEQMIYDISSDLYYYPSVNIKYPYSPGTYLESLGYENELRPGSYYSNAFNGQDYYVFRIDDPAKLAAQLGKVSIGIEGVAEAFIADEDYIETGDINKYDYADPRNFEHLLFFVCSALTADYPPSSVQEEFDDDVVLSCEDIEEAIEKLATDEIPMPVNAAACDAKFAYRKVLPQVTFTSSYESV